MAQEYNFKNQIALITGGGSGVGFAVAKAFSSSGAKVVILGRNLEKLKSAQNELKKVGLCEIITADVSSAQSVKQAVSLVTKRFKGIDILVNCAGLYGPIGPFHTNNLEQWKNALGINFLGTVNMTRSVLPFMLKQKHGRIINLSGGGAVQPFPNFSTYATSKAAVVRFTETIAREYESKNIFINAIAPGAINTAVLDDVLKTGIKKVGKEFYEKSIEQQRTGGDSVEVAANLVLFLCSAKSKGLTGRLVSAKWDPWKKFTQKEIKRISKGSLYTLRRIDNRYFKAA